MASSTGSGTGTPISGGGISSGQGLGPVQPLPRTLLPLARYAAIMGISLPHFHQLAGVKAPLGAGCDKVWDQDAREALAWTLVQAEEMIAQELQFWPAPKFITAEQVDFGLSGVRSDWRNAEVDTRWKLVECFGTETLTLHEEDAFVTYQDLDGDPLEREETASLGTALYATLTACASECDVAVFFRVEDGAEDVAHPSWEIRPLKVDIDGTTMTIRIESSLLIKPDLWSVTEAECKNSDDTDLWIWDFDLTNLVSRVDIYCRTVNQQTPVTLRWDGVCDCPGVCQHRTQLACAYQVQNRYGGFVPRPATWNGTTNIEAVPLHIFPPESVLVNYRAGTPLDSRCQMNAQLERAIVKLTNALLPEPPCGFCDAAEVRWKRDRTNVDPLTPEAASLPWDLYTQGALEAWRIIKRLAMGRGGKLGR